MSTILIQKEIPREPRTEPKLPTIINKNLTVLQWDWELPSTILTSKWADKHPQCFGSFHSKSGDNKSSFCGQGLILHYYGWNGGGPDPRDSTVHIPYKLYGHSPDRIEAQHHFQQIVPYNDHFRFGFDMIGEMIKRQGI